jgi:hypothetical protein
VINGRNVVSVPLSNVGNQFYLLSFE